MIYIRASSSIWPTSHRFLVLFQALRKSKTLKHPVPKIQKNIYTVRGQQGSALHSTEAKKNAVTHHFHLQGLSHNTVKSPIWKIHYAWINNIVIKKLQSWTRSVTLSSRSLLKETIQLSNVSPDSSQLWSSASESSVNEAWWAQFPSHKPTCIQK